MNTDDINSEIKRLLQDSSYDSCQKLASLYIVRDHLQRTESTQKELFDILPTYSSYANIKREYELGNAGERAVINLMRDLCKEIKEFIIALHISTHSADERAHIYKTLDDLQKFFQKSVDK